MNDLHVLFRVGSAEYAVPAADVAQMDSYSGATPVPGAASYLAGIVQVRGQVVPVIDLRARFGLPPAETTLDSRVVVLGIDGRRVGLLVDSAREVSRIAPEQVKDPPPLVASQSAGMVRAVAHLGRRIVMLVDIPRIVGEEQLHVRDA